MSKKGKDEAARMVEDAVAKAAKKLQEDKAISEAKRNELLAKNARAADAVRKKMGTD